MRRLYEQIPKLYETIRLEYEERLRQKDKQPGVLARREWIRRGGGRSPAKIEMKIVVTSAIAVEASESGLRLSPVW